MDNKEKINVVFNKIADYVEANKYNFEIDNGETDFSLCVYGYDEYRKKQYLFFEIIFCNEPYSATFYAGDYHFDIHFLCVIFDYLKELDD